MDWWCRGCSYAGAAAVQGQCKVPAAAAASRDMRRASGSKGLFGGARAAGEGMGARLANPQPAACSPGRLNPARAWELESCVQVGGGWIGVFLSPEPELKGRRNDGPMELLIRLGCMAGLRVGCFVEKLMKGLLA